jgi:DNA-3-methyladenine glycosylase II
MNLIGINPRLKQPLYFEVKSQALPQMLRYHKKNLPGLYNTLAERDADLKNIINTCGHPPLWLRPNTFATLVLTILEQQVSLASAYAAYKKLEATIGTMTPENLLALTDAELRACYFSRQKIVYVRGLAAALLNKQLDLETLYEQPDAIVRNTLKQLKGIGDWTVDIYLIHALQRTDVFPVGDLALVKAMLVVKQLPHNSTKADLLTIAEAWRPYRTIATLLLWHFYLKSRGIKIIA